MKSIEKNSEKHFSKLMNCIQALENKTESIKIQMIVMEEKYESLSLVERDLDETYSIVEKNAEDIRDIKDDFKKIKSRVMKNKKTIKTLLKDIKSLKEVIEQT
jgi:septation ring formation regulator EzrA